MTITATAPQSRADNALAAYVPGLVLVAVITAAAYGVRHLPFMSPLSPMILAIFVGMLFANVVGSNISAAEGISISGKRLLRLAVALLGLQISFAQLAEIGVRGVGLAAIGLFSTFLFTIWMGKLLGVDRNVARLLAAGTAVCGASAIAAANAVTGADDEDTSYAVACITLFGTIAMFLFPFLNFVAGLSSHAYGLWVGLSVHEVAQVVGAGFQGGKEAGEIAVITKLSRIMMLAPLIIGMSFVLSRSSSRASDKKGQVPLVPFFVVGFLVLAALNSFGLVPEAIRSPIVTATPVLLTAAMAALGLGTSVSKLKQHGLRPFLLAGMATVFIAGVGFLMVTLVA
ncbi:MAG TPA: YeiH family protein [Mesorhizobium sp.]